MGFLGLFFIIIIFVLITVWIVLLFSIPCSIIKKEDKKTLLIGVIIFILCSIFILYFFITLKNDNAKMIKDFEFSIVAMENKTTYIHSRHSIDSQDRYYFIRDYGDNYQTGYIPQDESCLIISNNSPKIEVYKEEYNTFLGSVMNLDEQDSIHYKIYIPENTIKQDFDVDLSK